MQNSSHFPPESCVHQPPLPAPSHPAASRAPLPRREAAGVETWEMKRNLGGALSEGCR